ncbi:MAG: Choice-of-anchor protein, partial [Bacteroidota bacterium]|nr:Choice-of-anchor protein [Bacteroidota bacterium]
ECIDLEFEFVPSTLGYHSATMTIIGECNALTFFELTGTGRCSGERVPKVDFGIFKQNMKKDTLINCIIKNTNNEILIINPFIQGASAADFELLSGFGSIALQPNDCIDMEIRFAPKSTGAKSAYINYNMPLGCDSLATQLYCSDVVSAAEETNPSALMSAKLNLQLYPNPSDNYIYAVVNNSSGYNLDIIYKIYNSLGEEILVSEAIAGAPVKFQLSALAQGIYFIKAEEKNADINTEPSARAIESFLIER